MALGCVPLYTWPPGRLLSLSFHHDFIPLAPGAARAYSSGRRGDRIGWWARRHPYRGASGVLAGYPAPNHAAIGEKASLNVWLAPEIANQPAYQQGRHVVPAGLSNGS